LERSAKNNITMSDNKTNTGQQDRIRVDANDPSEVEYLHSQFPEKTHQQIKDAIKEKGPLRKDIEAYLKGGK
jgi:hypothetical protein